MPFTPTHILAIVPIKLGFRALSFSGLAIGSMIPDLPMFFPFASYVFSHSMMGVFLFCVPVGLCVYFVFQFSIKNFLMDMLTNLYRSRLLEFKPAVYPKTLLAFVLLCVSIYIGAASHAIWDSFTHIDRWGTNTFPVLLQPLNLMGVELPGYKLIQYSSTIIGFPLLILLAHIWVMKRASNHDEKIFGSRNTFLAAVIASLALLYAYLTYYHFGRAESFHALVGVLIKQGIAVSIVVVCLFSLIHRWINKFNHGKLVEE